MQQQWDFRITPASAWFNFNWKELYRYKDLLWLFVRRDFVTVYKQTILGPLWFFIQPILTTIIFTVVFDGIAGISTDGVPPVLFYMSGVIAWNYFAECLNKTSNVFTVNASIFGKVYFPRLIVPVSIVISGLLKLAIQLVLLMAIWLYFYKQSAPIELNEFILLLPFLVILMAGLGLGAGIIISSLTTKYRDMQFLVMFSVQLLMYASPVIYPLSSVSGKLKLVILANPMTSVIETFRYMFLGKGLFEWVYLAYTSGFVCVLLIAGIIVFTRVEKNFMDTV